MRTDRDLMWRLRELTGDDRGPPLLNRSMAEDYGARRFFREMSTITWRTDRRGTPDPSGVAGNRAGTGAGPGRGLRRISTIGDTPPRPPRISPPWPDPGGARPPRDAGESSRRARRR